RGVWWIPRLRDGIRGQQDRWRLCQYSDHPGQLQWHRWRDSVRMNARDGTAGRAGRWPSISGDEPASELTRPPWREPFVLEVWLPPRPDDWPAGAAPQSGEGIGTRATVDRFCRQSCRSKTAGQTAQKGGKPTFGLHFCAV